MRIKIGDLRHLIKEAVQAQHYPEITLSDGAKVPWGSPEHVKDMHMVVAGLQCLRDQQRRGTSNRSIFAQACNKLNAMIRKAESTQQPVEIDVRPPRTFSSLESGHDKGKEKPKKLEGTPRGVPHDAGGSGRTGYGKGAPAHGRYPGASK